MPAVKDNETDLEVLLRQKEVIRLVGVTRVTLWRWARQGHFPKPVRLVGPSIAWRRSDVAAWLDSRPSA